MDSAFYKSLAALGEVGMRKAAYRTRLFLLVVIPVIAVMCAPLLAWKAFPGLRYLGLVIGLGCACFAIAEHVARKRLPAIISEVAAKYGVPIEQLRHDSLKHIEAA